MASGAVVPHEGADTNPAALAQALSGMQIKNVVGACKITADDVKIDLRQLVQAARNAEYNPQYSDQRYELKRFSALVMRLREPKATALIFASGKMVVLGAKDEISAKVAARKFAKIVKLCGVPEVKFRDWEVKNMVCVIDCRFPIKLEGLALEHIKHAQFEPELFPGLIYRLNEPKVVLLIFVSGKVVITGAKNESALRQAFSAMFFVIHKYRKEMLTTIPAQIPAQPLRHI